MSKKGLFAFWAALAIFQALIAVGLFTVAYSDTFGLERIAANGEKIVGQLGQIERLGSSVPGESQPVAIGQLRALLQANNHAFRQLGKLTAWVGGALLVSALLQLGVLLALTRKLAPSGGGSSRNSSPAI